MEKSSFYNPDAHQCPKNGNSPAESRTSGASSFREKNPGAGHQSFALELVPGRVCELNCECCYKKNGSGGKDGAIPFDDATNYIVQAKEEGFGEIVLIGGEPLLHPQIFELIRFIRGRMQLTPILVTNAVRLANEETADQLNGQEVVLVTHAYLPGGESVIDKFAGKKGYAEILHRAIKNIRQIPGVKLVLEMPLCDTLFPHAFDFFRYCREEGITPFIEISRATDGGKATTSVTPEQVSELFNRLREYDRLHFPGFEDAVICPPAYGNKCTMSITGLHVKNLSNGDFGGVYSCCAQKIRHGDLRKEPLHEIMQSPTLTVFAEQDRYIVGPCKDCEIYDTCKGGCRGQAYLKFGCPRASSPTCHLIPKDIRENPYVMAPSSCDGCPAENCGSCHLTSASNE